MTTEPENQIIRKTKIINTAKEAGYDYVLLSGKWNEYYVYEPICWSDVMTDKAEFILVRNDEIRWTKDAEEALKVTEEAEKYLADETNIKPLEPEPNITIKSFKFARGGAGGNFQLFEYKSNKKGNILTHTEEGDCEPSVEPAKVKIGDEKFNEYALGMIKYFHEDAGEAPGFCGGEWYDFKATLSDGKKLKSCGYNYFPFGYNKFIAFLEHYWDDKRNIFEYLPMKKSEN